MGLTLQQRGEIIRLCDQQVKSNDINISITFQGLDLQTPKKDVAQKFNILPRTVGSILAKRKEIEADLSSGINPKRLKVRSSCLLIALTQTYTQTQIEAHTQSQIQNHSFSFFL